MLRRIRIIFLPLTIIFLINCEVHSQYIDSTKSLQNKFAPLILNKDKSPYNYSKTNLESSQASVIPIAIGIWTFLYLLNPIILYEDDKIAGGITKELSLGFGEFGEYRLGFEYSYIFRENQSSQIRISGHYDNLLKSDIKPSNMLQGTPVLSFGGGYFTDFDGSGIYPEIAYGYSIRNDKFLFFPHIKARHTFMTTKNKASITDFSFGIIIGIANPFIDLKIRNKH